MNEISVVVKLKVDSDGHLTEPQHKRCAFEAVERALSAAGNAGFSYTFSHLASVEVESVIVK